MTSCCDTRYDLPIPRVLTTTELEWKHHWMVSVLRLGLTVQYLMTQFYFRFCPMLPHPSCRHILFISAPATSNQCLPAVGSEAQGPRVKYIYYTKSSLAKGYSRIYYIYLQLVSVDKPCNDQLFLKLVGYLSCFTGVGTLLLVTSSKINQVVGFSPCLPLSLFCLLFEAILISSFGTQYTSLVVIMQPGIYPFDWSQSQQTWLCLLLTKLLNRHSSVSSIFATHKKKPNSFVTYTDDRGWCTHDWYCNNM